VTLLTGRPVTLANGDWADLANGVTAYTRPSWRRTISGRRVSGVGSTPRSRC
jgi:hypothetical protein